MAGNKPVYCWDTCVLIAWITGEPRTDGDMGAVQQYVNHIDCGEASLITSVITITEMLDSKVDQPAVTKFRHITDRSNVQLVDVTVPIAELASQIRDYYLLLHGRDDGGKITTPDAIHLATALIHGASEFNTFDDGKKEKDLRSLLSLNGNVAGHPLIVRKPAVGQLPLPL